jgi:DNA-binding NarL/FixJ family response regulator
MAANSTRVFIIDDHPVVRAGLRELLKQTREIAIVGDAEDGAPETVARISELAVDVAIVDIKLKRGDGIEACKDIKQVRPSAAVILLSAFWDDSLVRQALDARADGYLLKDAEHFDLVRSIAVVARGESMFDPAISAAIVRQARGEDNGATGSKLSAEDIEILRLVAEGQTNKAIGGALFLSHHTVRDKLSMAMALLGARNRTEAVQIATRRGII